MNFFSKLFLTLFILLSFSAVASNQCSYEDNKNKFNLEYCIERAKSGNVSAQYSLGMAYLKGANYLPTFYIDENNNSIISKKVDADYIKSFFWFNEASKNNDTESMLWLSSSYLSGKGTIEDIDKSFYYINLAAKNNSQNAKLILAAMYEIISEQAKR